MSKPRPRAFPRRLPALALALFPLFPAAARPQAPPAEGRVIVLGFDGADARTVEAMMASGELPNLSRLAERGTFAPLLSTNPSESPVAWSSLETGQNPAKTGVPGFVRRDLIGSGTPIPNMGFREDVRRPIASFDHAPLPPWRAWQLALALGAAVAVGFGIVFALLLRMRLALSIGLSLVLGALGAWGGAHLRGYLPDEVPVVANPLKATPFWETAAASGVESVVLDAAQAFDREPVDGARVLAGLGVPDATGQYNGFFLYTTDDLWFPREPSSQSDTGSGGDRIRVDLRDGVIESRIFGPKNFWKLERIDRELERLREEQKDPNVRGARAAGITDRIDELKRARDAAVMTLPLRAELTEGGARLTLGERTQELAEGEWSDWYHLSFELNPLIEIRAITRAKILTLREPYFEMYLDTLQIDPAAPPFWQPISQPFGFASDLARRHGPFETVGWACMTMPFKDGVLDPVSFLEDIEFTLGWREEMTMASLEKGDWRLFMSCFSTPDRLQHMMYQYYDATHPLYDPQEAARTATFFGERISFADAIPAIYRQVDRLVGKVMDEHLRPEDTLILCADHGFQSFRREVHVNNWLAEKGYLALVPGAGKSSLVTDYVDWSKTRAYSIGLGMVYLNLRGRESKGIVEPEEADELLRRIRADFLASTDPDSGEPFGAEAWLTKEIHSGPHLDLEADLMLGFREGYRVSWATTSGGIQLERSPDGGMAPGPVVRDNKKNWSGDHVSVDPALVRGIFFCSRPLPMPEGGADLRHVAPTVLALLGVPIPPEYDLEPLRVEN